jgi:hypothetical protein
MIELSGLRFVGPPVCFARSTAGEFARFILPHPNSRQLALDIVPTRQFAQSDPAGQVLFSQLMLALSRVGSIPAVEVLDKALNRHLSAAKTSQ